eukprot:4295667-Lingulodinium_polyedra.AAC.1
MQEGPGAQHLGLHGLVALVHMSHGAMCLLHSCGGPLGMCQALETIQQELLVVTCQDQLLNLQGDLVAQSFGFGQLPQVVPSVAMDQLPWIGPGWLQDLLVHEGLGHMAGIETFVSKGSP